MPKQTRVRKPKSSFDVALKDAERQLELKSKELAFAQITVARLQDELPRLQMIIAAFTGKHVPPQGIAAARPDPTRAHEVPEGASFIAANGEKPSYAPPTQADIDEMVAKDPILGGADGEPTEE